jgi:hypothetical protein
MHSAEQTTREMASVLKTYYLLRLAYLSLAQLTHKLDQY